MLNVKSIYNLFKELYPSVKVLWLYFTENFNLRFGQRKIDTCYTCAELKVKIKSPHLNEVAKRTVVAELAVHVRRAIKMYRSIKQDKSNASVHKICNVLSWVIDCMQNISMPKMPVQ